MAVIKTNLNPADSQSILIIGGSLCGLVCMVIALLGIKLKWFKHRMTFDDNPTEVAAPARRSRNENMANEPQIVRATFRSGVDFDNFVDITPPAVLPPVRITNKRPPLRPLKKAAPGIPEPITSNSDIRGQSAENRPLVHSAQQNKSPRIQAKEVHHEVPPPLPASPPPTQSSQSPLLLAEPVSVELSPLATRNKKEYVIQQEEKTPKQTKKSQAPQKEPIITIPPPPPYEYQPDPQKPEEHFKKFSKNKKPPPAATIIPSTPALTDAAKKNSFLYQVATPTEVPFLKPATPPIVFASMPELHQPPPLQNKEKIADKTLAASSIDLNTPTPVSADRIPEKPAKSSIFSFMSSKNADKEITAKTEKEKQKKLKTVRVLKEPKPEKIKESKQEKVKEPKPEKVKDPKPEKIKDPKPEKVKEPKPEKIKEPKPEKVKEGTPEKLKESKQEKVKEAKTDKVKQKKAEKEIKSEQKTEKTNSEIKTEQKKIMKNAMVQGSASSPDENPAMIFAKVSPKENGIESATGVSPSFPKKNQPVPKQRTILNLEPTENPASNNSKKPASSPSSPSDDEADDTWNLLAQHRKNTQSMAMAQAAAKARQKTPIAEPKQHTPHAEPIEMGGRITIEQLQQSKLLQKQRNQIDLINKPKTMREMRKDQMMKKQADNPPQRRDVEFRFENGETGGGGGGGGGPTSKKDADSDTEV